MRRSSVACARSYRFTLGSGSFSSHGANGDIVNGKASKTVVNAWRTAPASASTSVPNSVSPAMVSVSLVISAATSSCSPSRQRSAARCACATIDAA